VLLVLDIGNTQITLGLFQADRLVARWHFATDVQKTADEYTLLLSTSIHPHTPEAISGAILSSVVPPLTATIQTALRAAFSVDALIVTQKLKTALRIRYTEELGADRIVNAVAAYHLYGGPRVIVDFGTATTFCALSETGDYLGGAITPGLATSAEALFTRTAQLPRVPLMKSKQVLGTDTVTGIQAGIFWGHVGLVNEMVRRIWQEMGRDAPVTATGGLCEFIAPECVTISRICPNLTLEGLRILYNMNRTD
jgi:type III pantothenate kinase